jgi:hypothetical protein
MIDWNKLFGLLFLVSCVVFIFEEYDDRKLLRSLFEEVADKIRPQLGLMTRQEVAAEQQRLQYLASAAKDAELKLADKIEQERLAKQRQLAQERLAQEEQERELEQERLAREEEERAAKYAAALDRAYALSRGELPRRPAQLSNSNSDHADDLDDSIMSSFRYGGIYLTDARVIDLTARGVKVEGTDGSGDSSVIVVPLEEAAQRVDLKLKVGKQIAAAMANPSKWKRAWQFPHHYVAPPSRSLERPKRPNEFASVVPDQATPSVTQGEESPLYTCSRCGRVSSRPTGDLCVKNEGGRQQDGSYRFNNAEMPHDWRKIN